MAARQHVIGDMFDDYDGQESAATGGAGYGLGPRKGHKRPAAKATTSDNGAAAPRSARAKPNPKPARPKPLAAAPRHATGVPVRGSTCGAEYMEGSGKVQGRSTWGAEYMGDGSGLESGNESERGAESGPDVESGFDQPAAEVQAAADAAAEAAAARAAAEAAAAEAAARAAAAAAKAAPPAQSGPPVLQNWRELEDGRFRGMVYCKPGTTDGKWITTSHVPPHRRDPATSTVWTETGSTYKLGEPAGVGDGR